MPGTPGDLTATTGVRVTGGLAAVFSKELTRHSIWQSLWDRKCYGTSGARIYLEFNADGHGMGSDIETAEIKQLNCQVAGTAPLHKVQIIRTSDKVFKTFNLAGAEPVQNTNRYRICFTSSTEPDNPHSNKSYDVPTKNWGIVSIAVSGNRIVSLKPFNQAKRSFSVIQRSKDGVSFSLTSRGDECGFVLITEDSDTGRIVLKIENQEYTVDLSRKQGSNFTLGIGGVEVERLQDKDIYDFQETLLSIPIEDTHEYFYLTASQIDGMKAWSSPIFVSRKNERNRLM